MTEQISAAQEEAIKATEEATEGFLKVFLGTNFFLSFFLIGILQFLWGLINTLQMIMLTVLLAIEMPSNCYRIMIAIMKLTNLDVIDTGPLIESIFTFKSEYPPLNEIFAEAGYETSNYIIELNALFVIIVISTIIYLIRRGLLILTEKCCG